MIDLIGQELHLHDVVVYANLELTLGVINIIEDNKLIFVVGLYQEDLKNRYIFKTYQPEVDLLKIIHFHYKSLNNEYLNRIVKLQRELIN